MEVLSRGTIVLSIEEATKLLHGELKTEALETIKKSKKKAFLFKGKEPLSNENDDIDLDTPSVSFIKKVKEYADLKTAKDNKITQIKMSTVVALLNDILENYKYSFNDNLLTISLGNISKEEAVKIESQIKSILGKSKSILKGPNGGKLIIRNNFDHRWIDIDNQKIFIRPGADF